MRVIQQQDSGMVLQEVINIRLPLSYESCRRDAPLRASQIIYYLHTVLSY